MARPGRPERNRAARSFRQLRRFHHVINSDEVFGTHNSVRAYVFRFALQTRTLLDAVGMVSKVPDLVIPTTAMRHNGSFGHGPNACAGVCRSQFDDQRRRPKQPYSGRCDDHLVAKCLATANAPRSLVSRAIFCASITSPATRQSLGTKHQPAIGRPESSSSWMLVPVPWRIRYRLPLWQPVT
jgi:hypothetical protein